MILLFLLLRIAPYVSKIEPSSSSWTISTVFFLTVNFGMFSAYEKKQILNSKTQQAINYCKDKKIRNTSM